MRGRGALALHARDLARNLVAGVRLALFLPVRADDFRVSPLHFTLLAAFSFAMWVGAAAFRSGFEGDFDPAAISIYLCTLSLSLAAALAVAYAYRAPDMLLLVAVALVASEPVFEVAGLVVPAISELIGRPAATFGAFLVWGWLISLRAVVVTCGWRPLQFLAAAVAVSAITWLSFDIVPRTDVWLPRFEEPDTVALAEERLFHLQGQLIERQLAAIAPGRRGAAELYFVGFAPDASQEVFLRELRFVKRMFDERFATAGRSIALASSHSALDELPIASVTNLSRALARVGETMNADEDVLFLFLTAHGDREHRLSAFQPPLELARLTPTALARTLQDAGVKWRVIVVSACYAGGFVEPLRNDNSIVITAAASDRSSFGCEADRDFTYFGEAYFRDALSATRSFTAAFALAKDIVSKKEAAEKLTPSLPQMWVGPAIAERLKSFPD
jgi:hypothetical protein